MPALIPLSAVAPAEMDLLLAHEGRAWERELHWDYASTTALILSSIAARNFSGFALASARRIVGYSYYLPDRDRALVGSVHALPEAEAEGGSVQLLERVLAELVNEVGARRIESQFLHFGSEDLAPTFARWRFRRWARQFLRAPLGLVRARLGEPAPGVELRVLRPSDVKAAGAIVFDSFAGTPDAEMSQCYASVEGAVGFVESIIARTGCGIHESTACFIAMVQGNASGVVLASRLSPRAAHIVQISVRPSAQGQGVGRALLGAALTSLERRGFATVSLSVTVSNERARAWYQTLGFEPVKEFGAYLRLRH